MLDAIIISDTGNDTLSASSPMRLQIEGKIASIQIIKNFLENNGKLTPPIEGDNFSNWHCAPKLNGIKLYSYLQSQGHEVGLVDSFYQEREEFLTLLKDSPKAVIISTTFIISKKTLYDLAKAIRSEAPDIKIIAGGPFILSSYLLFNLISDKNYDTFSPKDDYVFSTNTDRPDIDLYVIDKGGEQILSAAINNIKRGKSLEGLPNTSHWAGNRYHFSPRVESNPIDFSIDWSNLPDKVFSRGVVNVQASIGCPYHCKFCNFIKDHKFNYIKPVEMLVSELKAISAKGVKYVRFVDDNFRLGKKDLGEVCHTFIKENLDLKWMSFIRANVLESLDTQLLERAGCIEAQMGIESADEQVLKNMNKMASPEMYHRVISNLLNSGINCSCCFIVGFPGETSDSFGRTVDFIESIPEDNQAGIFYWSIYPFLLAPLSEIYTPEARAQYRLKGYMQNWSHLSMNSDEAKNLIIQAFLKIKNSSPIYSNDNIDMLNALTNEKRKAFMVARHNLAKRSLLNQLDETSIFNAFSDLLDFGIRPQ